MAKKKHKVLRRVRTKGVVYLMQNPDDPLDIKGEVTDLEVMATLKIKKSRFDSYVSVLAPFYRGCILIEKETKDKRYLTNEPVLIHTTESGRKYYAYPDCTVRYAKKSGGMKTLSIYKHKTKYKHGVLVRSWPSSRKAAKDLFCSYQTVLDTCHGKVKKPSFDVRFL